MLGALHAPVGDELVGFCAPDDAIPNQIVQHLGETEFSVGGDFGGSMHGVHYSGNAQRVQITPTVFAVIRPAACVNILPVCRAALVRAAITDRSLP
ncbi:MAG: hypothetical protein ACYC7B_11380 [Burkholderiales bacterium]